MDTKWQSAPHGFISEEFKVWYLSNCGYFYDLQREKEGYYPWVVNGDDLVSIMQIVEKKDKFTKRVEKVEEEINVLKAYNFDKKYSESKEEILKQYNDKELVTNENIFLTMQGKTIKIKGKDEFESIS